MAIGVRSRKSLMKKKLSEIPVLAAAVRSRGHSTVV